MTVLEAEVSAGAFDLLHPDVQQWVAKREWMSLRPIQSEAIQLILQTKTDVLIAAPTASGKTEAALLPVASALAGSQGRACGVSISRR